MGTIVKLPPPRLRRRASVQTHDEATILLFMGVRYVRDRDPAPERSQAAVQDREPAALELA